MDAYNIYKKEKEKLEAAMVEKKAAAAIEILTEIRKCIEEFGFTPEDLFPAPDPFPRKRRPRYFDPESGATWSGVGREPLWIRGKDRQQYQILDTSDLGSGKVDS